MIDQGAYLNRYIAQQAVIFIVDYGNIIIGCIGNIGIFISNSYRIRTSTSHNFGPFNHLPYLMPGFKAIDHLISRQVDRKNTHGFR